jgi:hypothetical protein
VVLADRLHQLRPPGRGRGEDGVAGLELGLLRQVAHADAALERQRPACPPLRPATMRKRVDFPEPFTPMKPTFSPSSTANDTPSKRVREPKLLWRSCTLRTFAMLASRDDLRAISGRKCNPAVAAAATRARRLEGG